eukprot:CAMPEP_0202364438 /NCGR_PEP_ID=MMETSP1126-20121109/15848_1 /ASSEMBLY_ACC=CAM_ASM_000457 /TAXON_ID=3047 /ORGANISM="Dunaliella tertiolecta, Strain CCMP1320" /LENGTH=70 /DNA_ID=CAMNT_0048959085 /DNA_START=849 /DNA_END=1061 /DNA_ORIENTATION=-
MSTGACLVSKIQFLACFINLVPWSGPESSMSGWISVCRERCWCTLAAEESATSGGVLCLGSKSMLTGPPA